MSVDQHTQVLAHLTTVHPRGDTRIFVKQCRTLAEAGVGDTWLVVADGLGDGELHGVTIHDVGCSTGGRIGRMVSGTWRTLLTVRNRQPRVVHFHDPELIPLGILLRIAGHRIVYDVHEDLPRQIMSKHWLPAPVRKPVSWVMSAVEWLVAKVFDAIVSATPKIAERFPPDKTVVVQNFPILSELVVPDPVPYAERRPDFAYVGGISDIRGAKEMVEAVGLIPKQYGARLQLAGSFRPASLENQLRALPGWERINFLGWVNRAQVAEVLGNVRAGLVVLHPTQNYPDAYPVKMFEYMAAGLPVIASDFPLWREIVEGAGCGVLVNPLDSNAIAEAMQWLLDRPEDAKEMGKRGHEAVKTHYNWSIEAEKLLRLYEGLLR